MGASTTREPVPSTNSGQALSSPKEQASEWNLVSLLKGIAQAVATLNPDQTARAVETALRAGIEPTKIVDQGLAAGMELVGERYQRQEVFLPELLMAEQCIRDGLAAIERFAGTENRPLLEAAQQRLAERASSWIPALSSCVTRLLHSSDSFLKA